MIVPTNDRDLVDRPTDVKGVDVTSRFRIWLGDGERNEIQSDLANRFFQLLFKQVAQFDCEAAGGVRFDYVGRLPVSITRSNVVATLVDGIYQNQMRSEYTASCSF